MRAPSGAVVLLVAYGAGLVTGLSRFLDPVVVLPTLVAAAWVVRRSVLAVGFVTLALGIVVGTFAGAAAKHSCAAVLPLGEQRLLVRTIDPGSSAGRVALPKVQCSGDVSARWPRGTRLGAGHDVVVIARWLPRPARLGNPAGLLLISKVVGMGGSPRWIDSTRTILAEASAALYGTRAALVDALITGRRGGLDPEIVRDFAASGLVHLLAISGSHIAVIAGWVLLLLRLAKLPRHASEALAVLAAMGYTAFIGYPPSAVRAAALLALVAFCRWRQRNVQVAALLAASALLVLSSDPWAIVDVGAWLSVLALAGASAMTRWSDRGFGTSGWIRTLSGSIGATVATAPVTAFAFGQVAPIGIVLNLIAIPLTAIVVPVLLVSLMLWHALPVLSVAFATSGSLLLGALAAIAHLGATAPGAATAGAGGLSAAIPWIAAALAGAWLIAGRTTPREAARRGAWAATAAVWFTLVPTRDAVARIGAGRLTLLFVDVGQGDAALIRTPNGHWFAVDAGPIDAGGRDAGRRVLLPLLSRAGVSRLDAFILSHAHRDHVGGAAALVDGIAIGAVVEPGEAFSDGAYDDWLSSLAAHHVRWHPARAGTEWVTDGVRFQLLHPPSAWPRQGEDLNEDSAVLLVSYGEFTALLMGDAGFVAESAMGGRLPETDLLKVGHHGSRWATGESFLREIAPAAGIVSVGRNRYGHPAPETMDRLAHAGVRVWRTDREGTTTVVTDGVTFTVHGGRSSATFAAQARTGPGSHRAGTPPRTH